MYSIDDAEFNIPGQEAPLTPNPEWEYIRDLDFRNIDSSQAQFHIGTGVSDVLISYELRKGKKDICMLRKQILVGLFLVSTMVLQTQLKVEMFH